MNRRHFIKSLLCLPFISLIPLAKTWYLKSGDSLSDAIEAAQPGDMIYLAPGVYGMRGTLTIENCTLTATGMTDTQYSFAGLNEIITTGNFKG